MNVFKTGKLPVKYWLKSIDDIETGCVKQLENLSNLPFAFHHIAAMPDTHQGYGMPIGAILATDGVIIPNAVGVDIGCGMIAVKTGAREISQDQIKQILGKAREIIPVGFNHHKEKQITDLFNFIPDVQIIKQELESARYQLGTLGGGNHFIEIQKGDDGYIWLMIHSGSRNLGKKVCDYYNNAAVALNKSYHSSVTAEQELAFLPIGTTIANDYLVAMEFCLAFAKANRNLMMNNFLSVFNEITGAFTELMINIHHNYAALENHFGKNVWIHRKGAIRMREGEIGIIPGSMGTPSYIVRGFGNKDSFMSSSHGAGRRMSRSEADKTFTEEEANKSIDGVVFGRWGRNRKGGLDLSECPLAYKNIDEVMENQADLVQPIVKLQPLGVMKG